MSVPAAFQRGADSSFLPNGMWTGLALISCVCGEPRRACDGLRFWRCLSHGCARREGGCRAAGAISGWREFDTRTRTGPMDRPDWPQFFHGSHGPTVQNCSHL